MPKTIEAIYEDGVFKPRTKPRLKEHEKVELTIFTQAEMDEAVQNALRIIGVGKSALKNSSIRHDEYLYGKKRSSKTSR
ncbi:MAG: antitoxin family protein [Nitrospirae bacterium]|nr:antitoxin family protein [Nitrospirota bacterium]